MKLLSRLSFAILVPSLCIALGGCGSADLSTDENKPSENSTTTNNTSENGTSSSKSSESQVKHVTDATFEQEVLKSDSPVLVDFWAPWCGPCQAMGPVVEELSNDLSGKVKVMKLNTDENPKTAQASNITGIPTLKLYKSGKVVEEVVGAVEKSFLTEKIKKHL